jgi:hypothetical protein
MCRLVFVGCVLLAGLWLAGAARPAERVRSECAPPDGLSTSWEAVFGHLASRGGADSLARRAAAASFKNASVERDGCGDFEVEVPGGSGLDTAAQRAGFRAEARQVGFRVSFEAPCCYSPETLGHGWFASLGGRQTLEAVTALELRALAVGFNHLEVEQSGSSSYLLLLPGGSGFATLAGRTSFAAEARNSSAHLAVSFLRR